MIRFVHSEDDVITLVRLQTYIFFKIILLIFLRVYLHYKLYLQRIRVHET
jgi:hypothetical protein